MVAARYLASSRGEAATQTDLMDAVGRTFPISVMRAESIRALRSWAEGRTPSEAAAQAHDESVHVV